METHTNLKSNAQEILSLEEIIYRYPDQWVLIVDPELDDDLNVIRGEVVAYSPDRNGLYDQLGLRKGRSSAIEYTGSTSDDAIIPL